MPPRTNTGPLRSVFPALLATSVLFLGGCGSAGPVAKESPSQAPTSTESPKEAKASISQGVQARRRATGPAQLSVVRVQRGDRLNVRSAPVADAKVVKRLRPQTYGLVPTGEEKAGWLQVRIAGATGWVKREYVGYIGAATSHATRVPALDIAATRRELAAKAATALGLGSSPVFVRVKHPVVVVDLLGEGDDSVAGTRLRIVLEFGEAGFQVKEAASRPICSRGLTPEGLCL